MFTLLSGSFNYTTHRILLDNYLNLEVLEVPPESSSLEERRWSEGPRPVRKPVSPGDVGSGYKDLA